ncbi:NAD-dependent epimerase/dehydratase family protein [Rubrimonas cliftonensis]|uniref:UDP-glucuronate 4-epimerase n=1 Tax=Rubrimonas cliftonensis TaxID=89524 RepID=A0A1H4CTK6_9RHOB|nr:NAD-dependent epimerase/dehydratase family protein [Rubrimonas cliftonensis]SEA63648.1 UDP-glucuronate 4-epimerase [Rubrimonas cliftonensis]
MTDPAAWAEHLRDEPPVLVTGAAGFIGMHVAERLLEAGLAVVGFDNVNDYYDVRLKRARLERLSGRPGFRFIEGDLADARALGAAFDAAGAPRRVIHLAAQAGVRHSLTNPGAYADSNLTGFLNVLEACRAAAPAHLVYASSSSVYGGNARLPLSPRDGVDHPVSLYAATKKANELMAHAYSHLYALPATGLRFFTVYGPWGRPDMAYWSFAEAIMAGRTLELYNMGEVSRDFTYVDDVVESLLRLAPLAPAPDPGFDRMNPDPARSWAPHRVYNIGRAEPAPVRALVAALEAELGRKAEVRLVPAQPGDVAATAADVADLERATGFVPQVTLAEGVRRFARWWTDWTVRAG